MKNEKVIIYHNPRCAKSREALQYLKSIGIEPEIIEYLKTPLDSSAIEKLLMKLNLPPEGIIRKKENLYKEKFANKRFNSHEWIEILAENPILIERPIVEKGHKAVLARPLENLKNWLK